MRQLTPHQHHVLRRVVAALSPVPGIRAVVLGGSHARGRARPDSDLDIGLYYAEDDPFDVQTIRSVAISLNDSPDPVVSDIGGWGRWVDGGAWLMIEGQRVDLLYRSLAHVERTLADAEAGRFEIDTEQQPPFGFFGPTILGELAIAQPLVDPDSIIVHLKTRVSPMPEALVRAVVQDRLWQVEFGLKAFAPKFAAAGDVYGVAGCLTRFSHALVLTLFALNRVYLLNDKSALAEVQEFGRAPHAFAALLQGTLGAIGSTPSSQDAAIAALHDLFCETRALAGDLYAPPWRF